MFKEKLFDIIFKDIRRTFWD